MRFGVFGLSADAAAIDVESAAKLTDADPKRCDDDDNDEEGIDENEDWARLFD